MKDLEAKKVASLLYSRGIFSMEDKDEVNSMSTAMERREMVLDILPRKGPKAFGVFCDILLEVSSHLEQLLRPVQEDGEMIALFERITIRSYCRLRAYVLPACIFFALGKLG